MSKLAILCVKNEAAFLLEWLAHHRAVGFDSFLVFSNDCEDGTYEMLDHLAKIGWVEHHRNDGPYHEGGIQFTALNLAAKLTPFKQADWILPLDIDEFVNIHVGAHRLDDLINALPQADAITLTWRLFGAAGQVRYQDRPITDVFTQSAPRIMHWPWRSAMFKTLYRNTGLYKKPGVHRPRAPDHDRVGQARWFDGSGRALPASFQTKRIFSNFGQDNYALAQLNHYPLGAMESYIVKSDRGRAVHASDRLGMDYWVERNFNTETDTSIQTLTPDRDAHLSTLLEDPTLAALHQSAVQWRKSQFDILMKQEPNRALFGRLMMTPATRPLTQQEASVLRHHAVAAQKTKT